MAELKPCPFCGENPELFMCNLEAFESLQFGVTWVVCCRKCHTKKVATSKYSLACDETTHKLRDGKYNVLEAWNRRADAKHTEFDFDYAAED